MKLLTTVGSFASRPHTCSLFFCSFSTCSSFFFLQPSCKQRKKHLDQNESPWKDARSEAAGCHWTGEGRVTLKLKPNTPSLQGMDENEDQAYWHRSYLTEPKVLFTWRYLYNNSCGGSQLYLVLFPLFLHLTHSSQGGCWLRGLSNIWHCSSDRDVEDVHSPWRGEAPDMPDSKAQHQIQPFVLTHRSKIKSWVTLRQ